MKEKLLCWDSVIFIDWILGKERLSPRNNSTIRSLFAQIESGQYRLVASTLVYVEALESTVAHGTAKKFGEFMRHMGRIETIAVDIPVAKKAQEIRNRNPKIETPDAVHLATAILTKSFVFHTFDEALLSLSGKPAVDGLVITACDVPGANIEIPPDY